MFFEISIGSIALGAADMAEAFLLAVGADLRRTPQQMQKIVDTVVRDNWFEEVLGCK